MPEISVIVPVYKVEPYLRRCVDSILAQTFTDFELILVDDGSPDGCPAICDEYAKLDSRVRVIHQENGGLSAARNAGLDIAVGSYIGFVDSDDVIHPRMYEILIELINRFGVDISSCHYQFIKPGEAVDYCACNAEAVSEATHFNCRELLEHLSENRRRVSLVSSCMRLCKKELYDNLRFKEGFVEEDSLLLPFLLERANSIVRVELPLYYWTVRENSITHSAFNAQNFSFMMVSYVWAEFFGKRGIKQQAKYFRKEFLNRCVEYWLKAEEHSLHEAYVPYRKLYEKNVARYYFTSGLCKMECLLQVAFLLKLPCVQHIYLKLFPCEEG